MGESETSDSLDRISQLPTDVLQDILFCLPSKDAARTCILSKSWNRLAWSTLPLLSFDFDQDKFCGKTAIMCIKESQEEFINLVDHSLQRLQRERVRIHKFRLVMTFYDSKIASFIDRWIELAANNYVQELYLIIGTGLFRKPVWYHFPKIALVSAGPLKVLFLERCKLERDSLYDDENPPRILYLQRLHLVNILVVTDNGDEIMQNFISRCPLIENINMLGCFGVKNLRLSNHPKLKEFKVDSLRLLRWNDQFDIFERIEVDVLNLQALDYCGQWNKPLVVHTTTRCCRNLKQLCLSYGRIEDHFFENLVSTFPLLESLVLRRCNGLKIVRISGPPSLKKLVIKYCKRLVELTVVDIPNLCLFKFGARTIPTNLLSINAASSSIPRAARFSLHLDEKLLNTSWFLELRNFLAQFNKHDLTLSLNIESSTYEFIAEELREISIPDLPSDVNHLKLRNSPSSLSNCATLIDGLLWSCHPKALSVTSDLESGNDFMKFLCKVLTEREEDPACCNSCHIKCWRHHLKDVAINSIDGSRDAMTNHKNALVESLLPTLATCKEVVFHLSWV